MLVGVLAAANNLSVTMFTPLSVACRQDDRDQQFKCAAVFELGGWVGNGRT